MTGRQTVTVLITAFVAVAVAGRVQQATGWPLAALTLVAIALTGGLLGRHVNNRELDRRKPQSPRQH